MQKGKRKSETEEVKIYVDTCVLQGALSRRNDEDVVFLKNLKKKNWKVFTSTYSLMELYEIAKDRKFLFNLAYDRWIDVNTFLRLRSHKNLNADDLDKIVKDLANFFTTNDFIEFMDITTDVWIDIKDIVEKSNLHSSDAMHLALARALGCHALVTHDKFFIKEGNRILEEAEVSDKIRVCDIKDAENIELQIREPK
jgi:predicted nucleic acid-binding protein